MNIEFDQTQLIALYHHLPQILQKEVVEVAVVEEFIKGNPRGKNLTLEIVNYGDYWIFKLDQDPDQDQGLLFPKPNRKINQYEYPTVKKIFNCQGYEDSETKTFTVKKPAQVTLTATRKKYELQSKGVLDFIPTSPLSQLELDLTEAQERNQQLQLKLNESEKQKQQVTSNLAQLEQHQELLLSELESNKNFSQKTLQILQERDNLIIQFQSLLHKQTEISNTNFTEVNQRLDQIEDSLNIQHQEQNEERSQLQDKLEQLNLEYQQKVRDLEAQIENYQQESKKLNETETNPFGLDLDLSDDEEIFELDLDLSDGESDGEEELDLDSLIEDTSSKPNPEFNLDDDPFSEKSSSDNDDFDLSSLLDDDSTENNDHGQYLEQLSQEEQWLVHYYQQNSGQLLTYADSVAVSEKTINEIWNSKANQIIFEESFEQNNYWLLRVQNSSNIYLLPAHNLRINTNFKVVQNIFKLNNFSKSGEQNEYTLIKPARVIPFSGDKWKLVEMGILQF